MTAGSPAGSRWTVERYQLIILVTVGLGSLAVLAHQDQWAHWRSLIVNPSEERFPVRGIDVSHHQGAIDWNEVRASGRSFAFIKASEGADFRDTRFADNWSGARAAGLHTGAYHFFTFCSPGDAQADNFLAAAPPGQNTLPPAIDIEFTGNCVAWESLASIRRELGAFVARVESESGRQPLLYTTEEVRRELVPPALHAHPYWIRSLWGEPGDELRWQFWQHSATGDVPGVAGPVDLNVFVGTESAWRAFVLGGEQATVP
jgi:lysozyme